MATGNSTALHRGVEEFFDLKYSNEPANYYTLIVEALDNGLKVCWYHKTKNLVTGFAFYPLEGGLTSESLKQLLIAHPFLASDFDECLCIDRSDNYALIPAGITEDEQRQLFELTNTRSADMRLAKQALININAHVVFEQNDEELSIFSTQFSSLKSISKVGARIEQSLNSLKASQKDMLLVAHIEASRVHLLGFDKSQLTLCNNFYQTSAEDVAYYILFSAEAIGLNPESTELVLSGDVAIGDSHWNTLSTYWKTIKIAGMLDGIECNPELDERPKPRYDYLSQHLLCAS